MFTIGFTIAPQADITALLFTDTSTLGGETVTSRVITITKSDLSSIDYPFTNPNDPEQTTLLISSILNKDYALEALFTVVTNVTTYTKAFRFVTLGYASKGRIARIRRLNIDSTIEDKEKYAKDTLNINYQILVANDRAMFGDLLGGQKALDFIADIMAQDANSPFSI